MLLPSAGPSPRCSSGLEARAGFRLNLPPKLSYGPATEPAAVNQLRPISNHPKSTLPHSPYPLPNRAIHKNPVTDFDGQSLPEASPGLQSSPSSIDRSGNISPSNLDEIQASLQAIQSTFQISDDLIRRAQPLFEMTPESRSIAILLLALHNGMSPQPSMPHDAPSRPYSTGFKTYVREHRILLREDIDCSGQRSARRLLASKAPHALIKAQIQQETETWRHSRLPRGYNEGLERKKERNTTASINEIVTNDKKKPIYLSFLRVLGAVHIHIDPQCGPKGAKDRLAYLRFIVNLDRLKNKPTSFWDGIDNDLHNMRRKLTGYLGSGSALYHTRTEPGLAYPTHVHP
ncbi:hypothetical protein PSTG_01058 [Puccinia striiformis f. sp. tritici PST-78]|uniref:Uncharacterized protein n=1 Tax=Puccinia striiformis f. sp. tritici PST-78 TaxID=1165861 RepID=A0A0L0W306_9BASI|nr:hypothetical protein PSTG_01058 [Puccinia striiformis f. sp. tritici PST-78]